jgi:hypothetical protein
MAVTVKETEKYGLLSGDIPDKYIVCFFRVEE